MISSNFWTNLQDFFQIEEKSFKAIYLRYSILCDLSQKDLFHKQIMKFIEHKVKILGDETSGLIIAVDNCKAILELINSHIDIKNNENIFWKLL